MVKAFRTPKTPKTPRTPKRKDPPKADENTPNVKVESEAKRPKQQELTSFFKPKEKPTPPRTVPQCMPDASCFKSLFQIKEGMTLAPIHVRQNLTDLERVQLLTLRCENSNYLADCKIRCSKKKLATNVGPLKAKYFHFHDNYRPPYYGTWRRRTAAITGRNPFSKKEKTINYEYDSDEDWEDEPADADECKSDDEDLEKDEPVDEEEENDGFFVDHGYLSSDEGSGAEDGAIDALNGTVENGGEHNTDEQRRRRLEQTAQEWKDQQRQIERRYKKRQLIPIVYLPDDEICQHPLYHRHIIAGVIFDYTKIPVSDTESAIKK